MKKIKRIILLIVLVFIYAELLSAHQGHYNKNENLSKTELSSKTTKTQVIEDVNNYNNCNSNDLMGLECCCCIMEYVFNLITAEIVKRMICRIKFHVRVNVKMQNQRMIFLLVKMIKFKIFTEYIF